jgi:hypothetical protein
MEQPLLLLLALQRIQHLSKVLLASGSQQSMGLAHKNMNSTGKLLALKLKIP